MKTVLWYSLEVPRLGTSNEYHQLMFLWRNKKNMLIPLLILSHIELRTGIPKQTVQDLNAAEGQFVQSLPFAIQKALFNLVMTRAALPFILCSGFFSIKNWIVPQNWSLYMLSMRVLSFKKIRQIYP